MAKKKKRSSKKKVTRSTKKKTKKSKKTTRSTKKKAKKTKKTKKVTRKSKAVKKKTKKTTKRSKAVKKKAKKTKKPKKKSTKARKSKAAVRPIVISRSAQQKPNDGLVAFLLEFVIGILGILGIGHIYNGNYSKGLFFMVGLWVYLLLIAVFLKFVEGASDNKTIVLILGGIWLVILLSSSHNAFKDARG